MKYTKVKFTGVLVCFSLLVGFPHSVLAERTITKNKSHQTNATWLAKQVNQHPDIIAAKEEMNAVFSNAQGSKLPLYNPELETGYEREGSDNNYSIGINQTIDWWDKRETKEQQANFSFTQARKYFDFLVQEKTAQALQALITWQAAKQQTAIAQEQEKQLGVLLDIVNDRQKAGDLGQVDVELTFLSLSQMLNITAKVQVQLKQAEAQIKELLLDWTPDKEVLPTQGLTISNYQFSPQWIEQHPLVIAAKAQWQMTKSDAQLALLATKADPTFGINTGRTDRESVLGVTFSIPLNIRNNYSAQARAANQQAIAAEANFRSVMRKQKFAIKSSADALTLTKKTTNAGNN